VHEREGKLPWVKRFLAKAEKAGRVLAHRVEEDWPLELRCDLAYDVDALRLEIADVAEAVLASPGSHEPRVTIETKQS
jgi:hypothetical protein